MGRLGLLHVFLGSCHPTAEVNLVPLAGFGFSGHFHFHGFSFLQRSRGAPHCGDLVGVGLAAGLGAVVRPLEPLKRMLLTGHLDARRWQVADALEGLHAAHPRPLARGMVRPQNPEPLQALRLGFGKTHPGQDDMGPGNAEDGGLIAGEVSAHGRRWLMSGYCFRGAKRGCSGSRGAGCGRPVGASRRGCG